jgi:hypothetical protein
MMISKIKNFLFSNVDAPKNVVYQALSNYITHLENKLITDLDSTYNFEVDENTIKPTNKYNSLFKKNAIKIIYMDGDVMLHKYVILITLNNVQSHHPVEYAGGVVDAFIEKNLNVKFMNNSFPFIAPFLAIYAKNKINESKSIPNSFTFLNLIYSENSEISYKDFFDIHFSESATAGTSRDIILTSLECIIGNITLDSYFSKIYNSLITLN